MTGGWLKFATIFNPLNPISTVLREIIGRKLGELLLDADMSLYLQHVVGLRNTIADYLLRNVQQCNSQQLLSIFEKYGKYSTPQNLRIVELLDEIFSWMLSIWEISIQMQGLPSAEKAREKKKSQPKPTIDTYLRNFDEFQKFEVFTSGFAYRIRRHNFAGTTSRDELRGSTIRTNHVFKVSQAFQQNGYEDPIRTRDG